MFERCIYCKILFNENNNSKEHIFPQSIGGNIILRSIFCCHCNSEFGQTIDKDLFDNFHFLCNMFKVYRPKGSKRPGYEFKLKGSEARVYLTKEGGIKHQSGVFSYDNKKQYIVTNDENELRRTIEIKKRKNPNLKIETTCKEPDEMFDFQSQITELIYSHGSKNVLKSIIKTAVTSFIFLSKTISQIEHVISSLKPFYCSNIIKPIFINPLSPPNVFEDSNVSHSVLIYYSEEKKAIFAIVELFNTFQYSVMLSNKYFGKFQIKELSQNAINGKINSHELIFNENEFLNSIESSNEIYLEEKFRLKLLPLVSFINKKLCSLFLGKKIGNNPYGIFPGTEITKEICNEYFNVKLQFKKYETQQ